MLPVLAGVGAGIWIYNELQEQSAAERERWRSKREEVERSIEWHEEQIENHLDEARQSYDFKVLIDMHYSCVKVADQAYSLLKDARISLDKIGEAIVKTKEQRDILFKRKKETISLSEKNEIQEEINSIQQLRTSLFYDKDEIKKQRDTFQDRVKDLNRKTHTLKISIKERTGTRGIEWFERLEARKYKKSVRLNKKTEFDSQFTFAMKHIETINTEDLYIKNNTEFTKSFEKEKQAITKDNTFGKIMETGSFSKIDATTSIDIEYYPNDKTSIEIIGSNTSSDQISVEIIDGTLYIEELVNNSYTVPLKIKCSSPFIEAIELTGSGNIYCSKLVHSKVQIILGGSGNIVVSDMLVDSSVIILEGSGDILIKGGSCKYSEVNLEGSGDIVLSSMNAKVANVVLEGSGDISIRVIDELHSLLKGSGDITIYGRPVINEQVIKGSGDISFAW